MWLWRVHVLSIQWVVVVMEGHCLYSSVYISLVKETRDIRNASWRLALRLEWRDSALLCTLLLTVVGSPWTLLLPQSWRRKSLQMKSSQWQVIKSAWNWGALAVVSCVALPIADSTVGCPLACDAHWWRFRVKVLGSAFVSWAIIFKPTPLVYKHIS